MLCPVAAYLTDGGERGGAGLHRAAPSHHTLHVKNNQQKLANLLFTFFFFYKYDIPSPGVFSIFQNHTSAVFCSDLGHCILSLSHFSSRVIFFSPFDVDDVIYFSQTLPFLFPITRSLHPSVAPAIHPPTPLASYVSVTKDPFRKYQSASLRGWVE